MIVYVTKILKIVASDPNRQYSNLWAFFKAQEKPWELLQWSDLKNLKKEELEPTFVCPNY